MNAAEMERESSRPGMMESVLMAFAIYVIFTFSNAETHPEAWCFQIFRTYFIFVTVLMVVFGVGCLIYTFTIGEDRGLPGVCKPFVHCQEVVKTRRRRARSEQPQGRSGDGGGLGDGDDEAYAGPSPMRGDASIAALEALGAGEQRAALDFSTPRADEVRAGSKVD